MLGQIKTLSLIILAVIASMVGLYSFGRRAGARATEQRQQQRAIKVMKEAQNVEAMVRGTGDSDVVERLRADWTRD